MASATKRPWKRKEKCIKPIVLCIYLVYGAQLLNQPIRGLVYCSDRYLAISSQWPDKARIILWPNFGTEIDAKRYDWIRVIRCILAEGYLDAKKGYLQLLTLTTTLKAVRKMANLAPRAFPLKVREKPWERGWKMARDKRDNLKIDFLTYWKASATTVWSVNSFSTILHLLCKKPITISKLNILGFHVTSSFSKRKKINPSEVLVSLVFQTLGPTGLLNMLNNKIMSSRFLSRDSWRGRSLNQLSRMEMESE